ncbi:MAG: hypothetical protein R3C61_05235 [Bacteroidia bacterium]
MAEEDSNEDLRKIIPFVKSWRVLYAFVLGELLVLIILFYWFSKLVA